MREYHLAPSGDRYVKVLPGNGELRSIGFNSFFLERDGLMDCVYLFQFHHGVSQICNDQRACPWRIASTTAIRPPLPTR